MKRMISMKDSTSTVPSTIIEDNISLTNPKDNDDAFNNYFPMWQLVLNLHKTF